MKLGRQFSNIVSLINQIEHNNANGVVMFNRSYTPDIDVNAMKFTSGNMFSDENNFLETMRWCGIASSEVPNIDIAASNGIYSSADVIKGILTGASALEICSVIYKEGPDIIPVLLSELEIWMKNHNYSTIKDFKGKMNFANFDDENFYERTQFMKYFSSGKQFPPTF